MRGLFGSMMAAASSSESLSLTDPADRWFGLDTGAQSNAGRRVTVDTAMKVSAVYACVNLLSKTVASLPLRMYRSTRDSKGRWKSTEEPNHPLNDLLEFQPNRWQTAWDFRALLQMHLSLRGNAYAEIISGPRGFADRLEPIHPDKMQKVERLPDGTLRYTFLDENNQRVVRLQDEMLHLRSAIAPGLLGVSPVTYARETIGLALATEEHGARLFSNGARPAGAVTLDKKMSDEAFARFKTEFNKQYGGLHNAGKVPILEDGAKFTTIALTNEDAQFLACTVAGTLITMADGTRKPVEDIVPGDLVLSWDNKLVARKVVQVGQPPRKQLIRVTTARGRVLTTSHDHPYLGLEAIRTAGGRPTKKAPGWIMAENLREGHYVKIALGSLEAGDPAENTDDAWFLGAMIGDGYTRAASFSFTTCDAGILERMQAYAESQGGGLKKIPSQKYDYLVLTGGNGCAGSPIRTLLNKAGVIGKLAHTKRVPDLIMASGPQSWAAFLSGYLDTDGTVAKPGAKQPMVSWASVNRELLDDCQHLLALLGVQSAIYEAAPAGERSFDRRVSPVRASWQLAVCGRGQLSKLSRLLSPAHSEKRIRLAGYSSLPASVYRDANWEYDRVASVEVLGDGETYGFEVEGTHNHVTNGVITHNTREFEIEEIARWFDVPLVLLHHMTKTSSWGTGVEAIMLAFVRNNLMPWLKCWTQGIRRDLISAPQIYEARFDVEELQRGDSKAQAEFFNKLVLAGVLTRNEAREALGYNWQEGLDEPLVPNSNAKPSDAPEEPASNASEIEE